VHRTFFLTLLLGLKLFCCSGEFVTCQEKARDSQAFSDSQGLSIVVDHHQRLIYTPYAMPTRYISYDPFLGLALVEDTQRFAFPYSMHSDRRDHLASITQHNYIAGEIQDLQCGLDRLGTFSKPITTPSLITDNCCVLSGIATENGIIDTHYLKHFLAFKQKRMRYGDAGIRLIEQNTHIIVSRVDPFFNEQSFKMGDEIVAFDHKKVRSVCELRRWILFAKVGSVHHFSIKRDGNILSKKIKIQERLGGGLLSDTFLERFGLHLDKQLCITHMSLKSVEMELDKGDCLIQLNYHDVYKAADIQKWVQKSDHDNALLFERRDFQFFIHINGKTGKITKKND
jgi:hypothetical protein